MASLKWMLRVNSASSARARALWISRLLLWVRPLESVWSSWITASRTISNKSRAREPTLSTRSRRSSKCRIRSRTKRMWRRLNNSSNSNNLPFPEASRRRSRRWSRNMETKTKKRGRWGWLCSGPRTLKASILRSTLNRRPRWHKKMKVSSR